MNDETTNGRWTPGISGNPSGRPPGTGEIAKLRADIGQHIPAIVEKLVAKALEGDPGAARLLLERVLPPIKASEQAAPLDLPEGTLAVQGRAVVAASAAGEISPGQAAQMLAGLSSLAKLIETDELAARVAALEAKKQ